jgi:hypothetical protein
MTGAPSAETGGLWFLPTDAPSWERALIYVVLGGVLALLAKAASMGVMALFDTSLAARRARLSPASEAFRLELGTLPSGDALVAASYLRGHRAAAADAVLAMAAAEGWVLKGDAPRTLAMFDVPPSGSMRSAKLRAKLLAPETTIESAQSAAMAVARDEAPRIELALLDQGLVRGPGVLFLGVVTQVFVACVIIAIGFGEATLAAQRGDPVVVPLGLAAAFAVAALAVARPDRRSHAGVRYLSWLEGATMSIASDVGTSRSTRAEDIALVGAVSGIEGVPLYRRCLDEARALTE